MVSRLLRLLTPVLVFTLGWLTVPVDAVAAKVYHAQRFDVSIRIEAGGSALVTERIAFAFGPDTFTSVYRGLRPRRTDGLDIVSVEMDGRTFTRGDEAWQYEFRREDEGVRRLVWHFAPVSGSVHIFTLTYRIKGLVRQDDGADVLEWYALPTNHDYRIDAATLHLIYPDNVTPLQSPTVDPPAPAAPEAGAVRFERTGLGKDDSWLVRAAFPARAVTPTIPDWQRRQRQASQRLPLFLGLAGMLLFAGLGSLTVFRLNHRAPAEPAPHAERPTPPESLSVTVGAALAQGGSVTWPIGLATIFDLARRGVVGIEETPGEGLFRKRGFVITARDLRQPLAPAERAVCDLLFTDKSGARSSRKMSELAQLFGSASRWKRVTGAVKEELRARAYIDPDRERLRGRVTMLGVILMVAGFIGLIAAVPFVREQGGAALMMGVAVLIVGLAGIGVGQSLTPLTDEAVRRSHEWKAYQRYLTRLSKEKTPLVPADGLDRLLPWAVAFGVGLAWVKALEKHGVTGGPAWFTALAGEPAAHMHATVALLTAGGEASHAVGHAGAGGAAAGAAGGGSSGAN